MTRLNGQTFGGLMKTAEISETKAGGFEVFVTDRKGNDYIVVMGYDQAHLLNEYNDIWMTVSGMAEKKLRNMLMECNEKNEGKYDY